MSQEKMRLVNKIFNKNIRDGVYECVYCKQSENKAEAPVEINLNSAVDLAYKKVPNRKKKIRQNK